MYLCTDGEAGSEGSSRDTTTGSASTTRSTGSTGSAGCTGSEDGYYGKPLDSRTSPVSTEKSKSNSRSPPRVNKVGGAPSPYNSFIRNSKGNEKKNC